MPKPNLTYSLLLPLFLLVSHLVFANTPKAELGILNLRNYNLSVNKISLKGSWVFYDGVLLDQQNHKAYAKSYIEFPQTFNDIRSSKEGQGFGTYYLQILLPSDSKNLAFDIPQIYSAYELWVNDKLIATNGRIGIIPEEVIPQWRPQTISFETSSDTLKVRLLVANFHHYLGGIREPIFLGPAKELVTNSKFTQWGIFIQAIVLFIIGIAAVFLYAVKATKRVVFYFAMLTIIWAVRTLFSNQYLFITYFPDFNWFAMVRIEYITLYLTMIYAILFLGRVFTDEDNKLVKYFFVGGNLFFIIFTLFLDPLHFTRWLPAYMIMSGLLILYGIIIVLRGLINERAGAWYLTISILLGLCIFAYDLLSYQGAFAYSVMIFGIGYIVIFFLLGMALLYHLEIFKSHTRKDIITFDDFYRKD